MTTILNGLLGGLLVGFVAAVAVRFLDSEPSATAALLRRVGGDRVASSRWGEFAVLTVYGGLAGGALLVLELFVLQVLAVPPAFGEALGVTMALSALLFVILVAVWRIGSSLPLARSRLGELLVYHLVYGLGLGIWIRMTWIT